MKCTLHAMKEICITKTSYNIIFLSTWALQLNLTHAGCKQMFTIKAIANLMKCPLHAMEACLPKAGKILNQSSIDIKIREESILHQNNILQYIHHTIDIVIIQNQLTFDSNLLCRIFYRLRGGHFHYCFGACPTAEETHIVRKC